MTKEIFTNVKTGEVTEVEMTPEQEAQRTADAVAWEQEVTARVQKINESDALKASAKAKLIAGEPLTEDEANTIVL